MIANGLLALLVSVALAPVVIGLLRQAGVYDVPNERSSHRSTVPRGVGVAPLVAVVVAGATSAGLSHHQKVALLAAAVVFGVIGLLDDLTGLSPLKRLVLQPVAAAAVLPWLLHGLGGSRALSAGTALAVVVWIVSYVNAYNFMDGIDGIAAAQALVAGGTWYLVGRSEDEMGLAAGGAILFGAALGFLPFNFPRAVAFLGDVGSYALGAALAVVAVLGIRAGVPPEAVLAPLAVALADTGSTLARRVRSGEAWYRPHRTHVYQRLTDLGWSHVRTTGVVTAWLVACSAVGSISLSDSTVVRAGSDLALVLLVIAYLMAPHWLGGRLQPAVAGGR